MIVMKFGGSSLKNAESIKSVAQIIKNKISLKPVIVASAMGKSTRNLLNCCLAAEIQNLSVYNKKFHEIRNYHIETSRQLNLLDTTAGFNEALNNYFSAIQTNLGKIQSEKKLNPMIQDSTLAYGELLSTLILSAYLSEININTQLIDVRKYIITDEHFTHATPIESVSSDKIRKNN